MNGSFRAQVGRLILVGAIVYCVLLTAVLAASTYFHCTIEQPVRDIVVIILTWITTKAGTVVDHQFGSSQGSEDKTLNCSQKEAEDSDPILPDPNFGFGVRQPNTHHSDELQDVGQQKPEELSRK